MRMLWSLRELGVQLQHILLGKISQLRRWLPIFRAVGWRLSLQIFHSFLCLSLYAFLSLPFSCRAKSIQLDFSLISDQPTRPYQTTIL